MNWKAFSYSPWKVVSGRPCYFLFWLVLATRNGFKEISKMLENFKFFQTHFSSSIPIRIRNNMAHRIQLFMDYKKMPFRSTNFSTLHGLLCITNQNSFMNISKCLLVIWSVYWSSNGKVPGSNPLTGNTYFFFKSVNLNFTL